MNEQIRHSEILSHLKRTGQVSVQELVDRFEISPATARRDINKLNDQKRLRKVRNGAVRVEREVELNASNSSIARGIEPPSLNEGSIDYIQEKDRIAEVAASLCQDGESVIINCGTTAFMMGSKLTGRNIQVITNYLPLANHLISEHHGKVIILGGQYYAGSGTTMTPFEGDARLYSANFMFTSGAGLTEQGLTKVDPMTVISEQKMLKQADKLVALIDSSKLGVRSGLQFCQASDIDILITDDKANPDILRALEQKGIQVILA